MCGCKEMLNDHVGIYIFLYGTCQSYRKPLRIKKFDRTLSDTGIVVRCTFSTNPVHPCEKPGGLVIA